METIQQWQQGNKFTITCRGHWAGVPEPASTVNLSDYDPYVSDGVASQIREVASDGNYNTIYDSFYAPTDFQISGIAFKLPEFLPKNVKYRVQFKVNGSVIELTEIPDEEDYNQKQYSVECSSVIFEDDFIEVDVTFSGNVDLLSFNEHNMVFSISGCAWYGMYKQVFADEVATVATTADIPLSGVLFIDEFSTSVGDVILVKDQDSSTENGLYVVSTGTWVRVVGYPSVGSLEGLIVYASYGATQNSIDTTNYLFVSGVTETPYIEWEEGDKWFKGQIHLQNRSGNEELTDRVVVDTVKATHNFLVQGISISAWNDPLMIVELLRSPTYCLYIDILVNGRSILASLNFPRPILLDTDKIFEEFDLDIFNDSEGYPIRFGDVVSLKLYQQNPYIRTNGKIIQCSLYGCGPDCSNIESPVVSIYEPCGDEPCEFKYKISDNCDPDAAKELRKNPEVVTTTPSLPVDMEYVSVDGLYVTINGKKVWI